MLEFVECVKMLPRSIVFLQKHRFLKRNSHWKKVFVPFLVSLFASGSVASLAVCLEARDERQLMLELMCTLTKEPYSYFCIQKVLLCVFFLATLCMQSGQETLLAINFVVQA